MTNTPKAPILRAYLGGSFDPVHRGHVQMLYQVAVALHAAQQAGGIGEYRLAFLPTAGSPFKAGQTAASHRLAMLKLAAAELTDRLVRELGDVPAVAVDDIELNRPPPSYTIDTLQVMRVRAPDDRHVLIMGLDSLLSLPRWKQGLELMDYAHLWVFGRQLDAVDDTHSLVQLLDVLTAAFCDDVCALYNKRTGCIYRDTRPIVPLSSTALRQRLQQGVSAPEGLSAAVWAYICQHRLYGSG